MNNTKTETVKHTPGPWRLAESALEQWIAGTTKSGAPDVIICDRPHIPMDDGRQVVWEANARLIAVAPEMLEALEKLVEVTGYDMRENDAWENAKTAIRKAKEEL